MTKSDRGTTLVELIVVLAILALLLTVVSASVGWSPSKGAGQGRGAVARDAAIRTGRPTTFRSAEGAAALFLPDGRSTGTGYDPLTGEATDAPR